MAHSKKNDKISRKKLMIYSVLALFTIAILVVAGALGNRMLAKKSAYTQDDITKADGRVEVNGQWYKQKNAIKTYLIMGIDKIEKEEVLGSVNNQQSDFNALIIVDIAKRSYTVLHLNRDTMTEVRQLALDGTAYSSKIEQLALAHTYGSGLKDSCENTAVAVSKLLFGAPIDHYCALYMSSISVLNDAVGGVTVTIEDDFTNVDPTMVKGETITLQGKQAEYFVRYRKDVADQTNLNRMTRQSVFLSAWKDLALEKNETDKNFVSNIFMDLGDDLVSDLSTNQISDMSRYMKEFTENEPLQLPGKSVRGDTYMEFHVDDDALMDMVLELFFDKV